MKRFTKHVPRARDSCTSYASKNTDYLTEMVFLNIVPLAVDFITITAYILHVINRYIRLIIIAIVIIYIWTELAKNPKLFQLY
jgi:ABC-type transport system involved in Fe-S cluster assembly fused permease/ATPase subunit